MNLILVVGIVQIFTASYLIYANAKKHRSTTYLYLLAGVGLLHLSLKAYLYFVVQDLDMFNRLFTGFAYGYGLMTFLYIIRFYDLPYSRNKVFYFHLLPFSLLLLASMFFVVEVLAFDHADWLSLYNLIFKYPVIIMSNFYTVVSGVKLWQAYKLHPRAKDSIRIVAIAVFAPLLVTVFILIGSLFFADSSFLNSPTNIRLAFYSSIIFMFIMLLQHHLKYQPIEELSEEDESNKKERKGYTTSRLESDELSVGANQLKELMLSKKVYLDSELNLDKLSKLSGLPKHHISEILNDHLQQNFYAYVNGFRIGEAKRRLIKNAETSIMDVAYSCGFKSKTSFNTHFKNSTGLTPSEFRASNLPDLAS